MPIECSNCESLVVPQKHVKPVWFLFWLVMFWPAAILYLLMAANTKCPRCGKNVYH